ncbi:MAG: FmdB family transcriptional regulator [Collinsella sp.]
MSETPEVVSQLRRSGGKTFSASGIKFEGNGFYNTDQRSGGSSTNATSGCCANCPHSH